MKKSIEEKLLKELIDRVIQKDRDIKNRHEEDAIKNATKEALLEMTELSIEEINTIEKDIRKNLNYKPKKYLIRSIIFIILGLTIGIFLYYFFTNENFNNDLVFEENFDNNTNAWPIYDDFIFREFIEGNKFIFMTNVDERCYSKKLEIEIPPKFTAEITSTYINGKEDKYGLRMSLGYASENTFYLHPANKTFIGPVFHNRKEPWISFPILTENGNKTHVQKIKATPIERESMYDMPTGEFKYYVNGKFIGEGIYNNPLKPSIALRVCGKQKVSFDHIKITNDYTGKIILNSTFNELMDLLKPKTEFKAISSIESGSYLFNTDVKGECYSSLIPHEISKFAKISLESRCLSGEDYYYGLLVENELGEFYAFELKADGTAAFIKNTNGKNELFIDKIKTSLPMHSREIVNQTVQFFKDKIVYYVNGKPVHVADYKPIKITKVGIRTCGRQSVAFDKLQVWE